MSGDGLGDRDEFERRLERLEQRVARLERQRPRWPGRRLDPQRLRPWLYVVHILMVGVGAAVLIGAGVRDALHGWAVILVGLGFVVAHVSRRPLNLPGFVFGVSSMVVWSTLVAWWAFQARRDELVIGGACLYAAAGPILGVEALRRVDWWPPVSRFRFSMRALLELTTAAAVVFASAGLWDARALFISIPIVYIVLLVRRSLMRLWLALYLILMLAIIPVALPADGSVINFLFWPLAVVAVYAALGWTFRIEQTLHRR